MQKTIRNLFFITLPITGSFVASFLLWLLFALACTAYEIIFSNTLSQHTLDVFTSFGALGGLLIGFTLSVIVYRKYEDKQSHSEVLPHKTIENDGAGVIVQKYFNKKPVTEKTRSANPIPIILLVLANLIPIYGVLFANWNSINVIYYYWLESLILGVFNIFKIYKTANYHKISPRSFVLAFIIRYFGIVVIVGVVSILLIYINIGSKAFVFNLNYTFITLAMFLVSHGLSYKSNFIDGKEYEKANLVEQVSDLSHRIYAVVAIILFNAFMYSIFHEPIQGVAMLVFFKILFDIWLHLNEHDFYQFWRTFID